MIMNEIMSPRKSVICFYHLMATCCICKLSVKIDVLYTSENNIDYRYIARLLTNIIFENLSIASPLEENLLLWIFLEPCAPMTFILNNLCYNIGTMS